MELIIAGSWLGKRGFYEALVNDIVFLEDINNIKISEGQDYFIVLSYDLSKDILEIPLRKSSFPPVILIKIKDFRRIKSELDSYHLKMTGSSISDEGFKEKVKEVKRLISEGTVYQINLTNRFDFNFRGDVRSLFFRFYRNQPVRYAFAFISEKFSILSGSMELFLKKDGRILQSKPIKGTSRNRRFLEESKKDKAENLMITDMMRNDLGRISRYGTVRVVNLFNIERYRTLYQMHSTVVGETDAGFVDIIRHTFPPASVTGAPKRKAVECIEVLEPHLRAYYCGSAGLITRDGNFELSVLIRTAIKNDDLISYYAGCGIVYDSVPEKELAELYLKVRAFMM